ncbi:hypothetical protein B0T26DRAFT_678257 [Lasiosphaeria miniovina]|uniref:Uncharacterized protein n=1 Tax=Lasiosphaeria miniovina TaxID=1954250 RepID=A0AA40ADS8_9PEZI|nr:uncharacterized protein B0T26DRAFT_678257 [Lasiosphaeria miniovina]KAK0713985.1 hypothetical protein B0T26DRAFT_678257 [Lasiosphaeria miniovina]
MTAAILTLMTAAILHSQLTHHGYMRKSFFDLDPQSSEPDEEGWIPELNPGTIRMLNVDPRNGVGLRCVPIFIEALRRRQVGHGRKCDFCLERFFEVDFDTIGGWVGACEGIEDNLPCPYPPCHRIMSNEEIRLYADPGTWKRYADHMRKEKNCQDNLPRRPV